MTSIRRKPDSAWSWLVCFASFITLTIANGSYYSFGLLLPSLMEQFKRSSAVTAWSGVLYLGLPFLMGPLTTHLCERFNFRVTAICGSLLAAAGFCVSSFADNFWLFFVMFSIPTGVGSACSFNCSVLVVLKCFVRWRALAVGISASSSSVGMFVISQITQALLSKYSWRGAVSGWAGLYVLAALCACTYGPSIGVHSDLDETVDDNSRKGNKHEPKKSYFTILRNSVYLVYLMSASLVLFSVFVPAVFLVQFSESELGISKDRVAIIYTYMAIAYFISTHVFCKLSNSRINTFYLYQFSMTVYGIGLLLLPLARTYTALMVCYIVFGLMSGGCFGLMPLLVLECVGRSKTDRAWGMLSFCIGVSSSVGPAVVGVTADSTGSYSPAFWLAGTVMLAGASLILFTKCSNEDAMEKISPLESVICIEKETVL